MIRNIISWTKEKSCWNLVYYEYWSAYSEMLIIQHNSYKSCYSFEIKNLEMTSIWYSFGPGSNLVRYMYLNCCSSRPGHCVHRVLVMDGKDHADGGLAISAPIHRQWGGIRGELMEGLPLSTLRHWSPQLAITLRWMWSSIWHLTRPLMQERRTRRGASQQAPWWGCQPCEKGLLSHICALRPLNIHRLCRAWREGQYQTVPFKGWSKSGGGLLIRYLWTQGTDSIYYMRVVNTDATSYQSKNPKKCL